MKYITQEFIDRMQESKEKRILSFMIKEFKELFPSRCRVLGDENLKLFLIHQQKRAGQYGYEYYIDLKRYALIAFYLGTYFDEDPFYPWVEEIMNDNDESFAVRVDRLIEQFRVFSLEVIGEEFIYFRDALINLSKVQYSFIESFKTYNRIISLIFNLYPQRANIIGRESLTKTIKAQKPIVIELDIYNPLGVFTYAMLTFMLGSKVLDDPLYAWVKKYMKKEFLNSKEKSLALFLKGKSRINKELISIHKNIIKEQNSCVQV